MMAGAESDNRRQALQMFCAQRTKRGQHCLHYVFLPKRGETSRTLGTEEPCQDIKNFPDILQPSSQPPQTGRKRDVGPQ